MRCRGRSWREGKIALVVAALLVCFPHQPRAVSRLFFSDTTTLDRSPVSLATM